MKNTSFYTDITDTDNNFQNSEKYLTVNCTGYTLYTEEVRAQSVRLDYYLMYLVRGIVNIVEPNVGRSLAPGDMIVFTPGKKFHYTKPDGIDMEYYWVHCSGYAAKDFLSSCRITPDKIFSVGSSESVCERFRKLFETFLNKDELFPLKSANRLEALLLKLSDRIQSKEQDSKTSDCVGVALSYIHSHVSQEISVEHLAHEAHLSSGHFRAVFKRAVGMSPQDYITLTRLNRACELLRETKLSISDISRMSGYPDNQYFCRIFKKHYAMPPGAYRSKIRFDPLKHQISGKNTDI